VFDPFGLALLFLLPERRLMNYGDFMRGLYYKFNMVYAKSKPFIVFGGRPKEEADYVEKVIAKVDSEAVLAKLKNKNMAEALCLIAQGYEQWEVALMMGLSIYTVQEYPQKIKRILKRLPK
jgi:hypothetical protein